MKNKAMTYILIVMVSFVWGIIIYRIVGALDGDEVPTFQAKTEVKTPLNDYTLTKDTTKLSLNYRDPFMPAKPNKDTMQIPVKTLMSSSPHVPLAPANPKPATNWNLIKYSGFIRNPKTKSLLAMVSINGKSLLLKEGEAAEDVLLLKNLRDSIKVKYQNKIKFITIRTEGS